MNFPKPTPFVPEAQKVSARRAADLAGRLMPLSTIKADFDARYLIKGWLDRGAASVIYWESNVGKTFFALDLALHVAAGTAWHGHRVRGGQVVYVACEGGEGIKMRFEAIRQALPELTACADTNFILLPASLNLHGDIDTMAIIAALGGLSQNLALVVIDTLARAMGEGDENTAKDMGIFVQKVDAIREATGAHVAIIHHSGKDAAKGARGSGSLRAAVDTEIELKKNGAVIVATTKKQRDMICGAEFAYRLATVNLGQDSDGDVVTSAIVQPVDTPPPRPEILKGQALIAMQAFDKALALHGQIKGGGDFPQKRQCVSLAHWREACGRHGLSVGVDKSAHRKAFGRAWKALQERGIIRVLDGFAWKVAEE